MQKDLMIVFMLWLTGAGHCFAANTVEPVVQVDIRVLPFYAAAQVPEGQPSVDVAKQLNEQLASNQSEDILKVRDFIQVRPQFTTPMTLMVLAIRLYEVGLRDEAVFWFYVAKDRYATMAATVNTQAPGLMQIQTAMRDFVLRTSPIINAYAYCDLLKQQELRLKSIAWVEQHPYQVLFMPKLPALPGDRLENINNAVREIEEQIMLERQFFADPLKLESFNQARESAQINAKFCAAV